MRNRLQTSVVVAAGMLVMCAAMAGAQPEPAPAPETAPAPDAVPVLVIDGRGYGHGVGMAQDGAHGMATAGASTPAILSHFYPGSTIGSASGTVHVEVFRTPKPATVVAFPGGGEVRESGSGTPSPGFPITVQPGGSVRLTFDGKAYRAIPLNGATPAATATSTPPAPPPASAASPPSPPATEPNLLGELLPPITLVPPAPPPSSAPPAAPPAEPVSGRSLLADPNGDSPVAVPDQGRRYRGQIEAIAAGRALQLINHLDVELYLRGMGEVMEPSWPAAALRAQAIAARTYALRAGGNLCSTQQCQVYLGETAEYAAMNKAVADTTGQVLRYRGTLVEALYSANAGGVSATAKEGFGPASNEQPYFRAAPYTTRNPDPWTVRLPLPEAARRLGYRGTASDARVSNAGPSGRALEIIFDGDAGPHAVDGQRFWKALGVRSTLFTLQVERPAAVAAASAGDAAGAVAPPPVGQQATHAGQPSQLTAGPAGSLGRTPWIALAALLMSAWGSAAHRTVRRPN